MDHIKYLKINEFDIGKFPSMYIADKYTDMSVLIKSHETYPNNTISDIFQQIHDLILNVQE